MNREHKKITHAISTSVLFDMREAAAVYREQGLGAYVQHMRERRDEPLPFSKAFETFEGFFETPEIHDVILASRNSPVTARRAVLSLRERGITPGRMFFTSGSSPVPYLQAYGVSAGSVFHTSNQDDAVAAHALGIMSPYYHQIPANDMQMPDAAADHADNVVVPIGSAVLKKPAPNIRPVFEGKKTADVIFDLDGVVLWPESEEFFRKHGLEAYMNREQALLAVPQGKGVAFDVFLNHLAINDRYSDQGPKPFNIHIVTAQGEHSGARTIETLNSWGIGSNVSAHFLSGTPKGPVLKVIADQAKRAGRKPPMFFDDQQNNVDQAAQAGITPGLILQDYEDGPVVA